jgi:hypothetical protein
VIEAISKIMEDETAGDPITGLKWTRKTTKKIATELSSLGIRVSKNTVGKLLKKMGYSLKVNHKKVSNCKCSSADRDAQFQYIAKLRKRFAKRGNPIVSVDTKKKELVGNFKNSGTAWRQAALQVNDHDFRSTAKGMAVPYGILDIEANRGSVFVGTSYDTPQFAVESIEKWWRAEGRQRYPGAKELLVLADNGGSNGPRCRTWLRGVQEVLCDVHGLSVTVAHYPPGCSKWNIVEHRLFAEISKNWKGMPLSSYEVVLKYIRTTKTSTGLQVKSKLVRKKYVKGLKVSDKEMHRLRLKRHTTLAKWNYTLKPRRNGK